MRRTRDGSAGRSSFARIVYRTSGNWDTDEDKKSERSARARLAARQPGHDMSRPAANPFVAPEVVGLARVTRESDLDNLLIAHYFKARAVPSGRSSRTELA